MRTWLPLAPGEWEALGRQEYLLTSTRLQILHVSYGNLVPWASSEHPLPFTHLNPLGLCWGPDTLCCDGAWQFHQNSRTKSCPLPPQTVMTLTQAITGDVDKKSKYTQQTQLLLFPYGPQYLLPAPRTQQGAMPEWALHPLPGHPCWGELSMRSPSPPGPPLVSCGCSDGTALPVVVSSPHPATPWRGWRTTASPGKTKTAHTHPGPPQTQRSLLHPAPGRNT